MHAGAFIGLLHRVLCTMNSKLASAKRCFRSHSLCHVAQHYFRLSGSMLFNIAQRLSLILLKGIERVVQLTKGLLKGCSLIGHSCLGRQALFLNLILAEALLCSRGHWGKSSSCLIPQGWLISSQQGLALLLTCISCLLSTYLYENSAFGPLWSRELDSTWSGANAGVPHTRWLFLLGFCCSRCPVLGALAWAAWHCLRRFMRLRLCLPWLTLRSHILCCFGLTSLGWGPKIYVIKTCHLSSAGCETKL